jgi:(1->4)-alpha-D-glucan 1-alpha-D-glucosylmutase
MYVVAEKILELGEELPTGWRVSGTTGYDYIAAVNGLWIDRAAEARLTKLYAELTGERTDFAAMVFDAKREIMDTSLSAETNMLGQALRRITEQDRRSRDFTLASLTNAIKDAIAAFPVYRTYVSPTGTRERDDDAHIAHAIALAKRKSRSVDPTVFDYLQDLLMLRINTPDAIQLAMRFQQLTGPVMAKGVEDTGLYRFNRLICLNEVGCDAAQFGNTPADFHAHNTRMLAAFPLTMTTTTTHDTKRGEDVRARLAVVSELPDRWEAWARAWIDPSRDLSTNDQYLFLQTVIGVWPFGGGADAAGALHDRLAAYLLKAAREAKLRTSWTKPDTAYEQAIAAYVPALLGDAAFAEACAKLVGELAPHGARNSLAQLALRLASPGGADLYQGCELWELALVDPDNRRPVDFAARRAALAQLDAGVDARALVDHYGDGLIKLHVTRTGLAQRKAKPLLFLEGAYLPIEGERVVAFERRHDRTHLVCIVPRLMTQPTISAGKAWPLGEVWGDQTLELREHAEWTHAFTGERLVGATLKLRDVFATFPVAWLIAGPPT